ncbi:MAG: sensor histidine kinase, partial [Ktedonobacteraceae bacterium]
MTNSTHTPRVLQIGGRSPYILWLTWIIWLPFLILTTVGWLQTQPTLPRLFATSVCLTLFVGYYLWSSLQEAKRILMDASSASLSKKTPVWLACTILMLLSFIITFLGSEHGYSWLTPFIYTSAYIGSRLSAKQAAWTVGGLICSMAAFGWLIGLRLSDIGSTALTCTMVIIVVMAVFGIMRANLALQAAHEEIERLAVTAERLRIARDLHDLLGHNLSLIALKSELARRLVSVAPERAASEIGDIEQVARTTLQEVREAVASYRQPALARELEAAQEILAAAGIACKYQGHEQILSGIPPAAEAILSWTVREGVTNVIKHSRAQHCMIALLRDEQSIG